jgi:hypothetical protein
MERRGRADADDGAIKARRAEALGGAHGERPLLLGHPFELRARAAVVGGAGMGHHPGEARPEALADGDQQRVVGRNTRAMAVTVDLDQRLDWHGLALGERPNGVGGLECVEDDPQRAAGAHQVGYFGQFHRRDADRVENVGDAVREEITRLGERRDGDRKFRARGEHAENVDRFGGLDVRAQRDPERAHLVAHPRRVALEARAIEEEGRGGEVEDGSWHGPLAGDRCPRQCPGLVPGSDGAQGRDRTTDTVIGRLVVTSRTFALTPQAADPIK